MLDIGVFSTRSCSGAVIEDTLGIWLARKFTMPSRYLTADLSVRLVMLEMVAILAGSGFTPSAVIMVPKYFTAFARNCSLSKLNSIFRSLALCKTFCNISSSTVSAAMIILSATMCIPPIPARLFNFSFETL